MKDEYNTYAGKAYRYISFKGLEDTIKNGSLRFTRVDELNDPLDNSPYLSPIKWHEYTLEECRFIKNELALRAFKTTYLCCFCKEYKTLNSYLLWSYYAKSHSQVCFEIDFSFVDYLGKPSTVTYPENLSEERDKNISTYGDLGLFVVTHKLKVWSHEEEVRLVIDTDHTNFNNKNYTISEDQKHIYAWFDIKYISKVIFGINSSKFDEFKIIDLFKQKQHSPKFEKMYINPKTLTLDCEDYKE